MEVIYRDRASAYADGARTGAPDAVQVADRFHLRQNLAKAVEKCVATHRTCLAEPALPASGEDAAPAPEPSVKFAERARAKHELVRRLRAEGRGLREIVRHLGWGLHTVQRYDRAATWQELAESRWPTDRPSKLDPFKPYLDQHAGEGHGSATRLFHEIKATGYDGSYPVVRTYLARHRPAKAPLGEAPPTVREVTNWLTRRPDTLTDHEQRRLKAILERCPELQTASDQVRGFAGMITHLTGQHLPQWIADTRDAALPGTASFAKGLEQDLDAVTNGLTMPWSHVNPGICPPVCPHSWQGTAPPGQQAGMPGRRGFASLGYGVTSTAKGSLSISLLVLMRGAVLTDHIAVEKVRNEPIGPIRPDVLIVCQAVPVSERRQACGEPTHARPRPRPAGAGLCRVLALVLRRDVLVEVPGPEADWELAAAYQGGKRNPALQGSLWDYAAGGFHLVAGLSPSLHALAARLRLDLERSWEDPLGEVDAALFSIGKIHFALSHNDGHPRPDTKVWVSRDQAAVDAALDVLLEALGIGREALTYYLDPETGTFVDLRAGAGG